MILDNYQIIKDDEGKQFVAVPIKDSNDWDKDRRGKSFWIDSREYRVHLLHGNMVTVCLIIKWDRYGGGKVSTFGGCAICNPRDTYDIDIGDRLAFKRALSSAGWQFEDRLHWEDPKKLSHLYRKYLRNEHD